MISPVHLPPGLEAQRALGGDWGDWLDRLPGLAAELAEEWQLSLDGDSMHGYCSLVLPVRTSSGRPAVLKLSFPDVESAHEALALQKWGGRGAVELLRADPHRSALLLERLQVTDLNDHWDIEACELIASLYPQLHLPAPPQLRRLSELAGAWAGRLAGDEARALPRRFVQRAAGLAAEFAVDPATDGRLIHTDLHYANVLAGYREEWLVIDPKPLNGDPHYEVAPLLWNRTEELRGDFHGGVRRRLEAVVDAAGLDEDRARAWVLVRMLVNALDPQPDPGWISLCMAVAKAVAD